MLIIIIHNSVQLRDHATRHLPPSRRERGGSGANAASALPLRDWHNFPQRCWGEAGRQQQQRGSGENNSRLLSLSCDVWVGGRVRAAEQLTTSCKSPGVAVVDHSLKVPRELKIQAVVAQRLSVAAFRPVQRLCGTCPDCFEAISDM